MFSLQKVIYFIKIIYYHIYNIADQEKSDVVLFNAKDFNSVKKVPIVTNKYINNKYIKNSTSKTFIPRDCSANLLQLTQENTWTKLYNINYLKREGMFFLETDLYNTPYFSCASLILAERITLISNIYLAYIHIDNQINKDSIEYQIKDSIEYQIKDSIEYQIKDSIEYQIDEYEILWKIMNDRGIIPVIETTFYKKLINLLDMGIHSPKKNTRYKILELINSDRISIDRIFDLSSLLPNLSPNEEVSIKMMRGALAWHQKETDWYQRKQYRLQLKEKQREIIASKYSQQGNIKVSVIIPVYNTEKYLDETLASICSQTLKEIEIICVNDGSSDDSADILEVWALKDNRIKVIDQPNGGLSCARNTGIEYACGEYLYFMDSDDLLDINALEEVYILSTQKQLDVLCFDADIFYDSDCDFKSYNFTPNYHRINNYSDVYTGQELFELFIDHEEYYVCAWLTFTKRIFLIEKDICFIEGILHEDNFYTFSIMLQANRASHINKPYFKRRIRSNSLMTSGHSFSNVYGYYISSLEMIKLYNRISNELSEPVRGVALFTISKVLQISAGIFKNLNIEEKGAQFSIGDDFSLFKVFISESSKILEEKEIIQKQLKQLQSLQVLPEKSQRALVATEANNSLRILYGDTAKQQYAELRSSGPTDRREVSFVSLQQDGQKRFNILLNSDGTRNWVTPEELKKLTERSGAPSEIASLEAKVAELTEQLKQLQAHWVTLEELQKVLSAHVGDRLRILYGDAEQYAELRTNGPNDKREVSLVSEQNGQKRFNILLNSDGTRNWVTPEELKRLTDCSSASERASLEAKVADLTEQLKQLQALQVAPEELKASSTSETALEAKVADLSEQLKQLQAHRVTPEELQKELSAHVGNRLRLLYGDAEKQQYAELRTNGPKNKQEISLVASSQQDGKKRFNILLNSDGTRNWATPKELIKLTEHSDASETALKAKVAELTEQLKSCMHKLNILTRHQKAMRRNAAHLVHRRLPPSLRRS